MLNYYVIIALNSPVFQLRFGWRNHYVDDPKMLDIINEPCSDATFTRIIHIHARNSNESAHTGSMQPCGITSDEMPFRWSW